MRKFEKECGIKCKSKKHAEELINAISKGNLRQTQLFLLQCHNTKRITDQYGRSVLHMAASCGKWRLLEWLLTDLGLEPGGKDAESGWTALHRALFYGELTSARMLIANNANIQVRDKEGLTALDIAMKDRLPHVEYVQSGLQDVYTWGDNSNFTLGRENEQRRRFPEVIERFRKRNISIKQVTMCKYHSIFLTTAGQVYTCGHGRGGRLGHGTEQTCLEPSLIEGVKGENCCVIAAARDHTIMLMENGALYGCGSNEFHQLGLVPVLPNCLVPKPMGNLKTLKGKNIVGVCTQRFHTVLYSTDAVFTFGLNAGQLGHIRVAGEKVLTQPRMVSALNHKGMHISLVTCSDAATVVYSSRGDIYVLHEYQCRKIVSKWLDVVKISVTGGHLDYSAHQDILRESGGSELCVAVLNSSGKVFLWRESDPVARRCQWSTKRSLHVTQMAFSLHNIAFITADGDGFTATLPKSVDIKSGKEPSNKSVTTTLSTTWEKCVLSVTELVTQDLVTALTIEKIPAVHRATDISVDPKARNYAILQCQPNACLTEIPQVPPGSNAEIGKQFQDLLSEADLYDVIHDCVLKIGSHDIPAHKYILVTRSEYFRKCFTENKNNEHCYVDETTQKPVVTLDDSIDLAIFKQLLLYLYTDTCDILTQGKKVDNISVLTSDNITSLFNGKENLDSNSQDTGHDSIVINNNDSAFAVNSKLQKHNSSSKSKKGSQKKGGKKADGNSQNAHRQTKNPVVLLQEMGRKLGVKNLVKKTEAVKCSAGTIQLITGRHVAPPRVRFERHKFKELYDVSLSCQDGVILQAHRCVLVGRLEYFRSMLGSGWIETTTATPLSIPIPSDVMAVVLDYLYTDTSPVIESCEDAEFLCNILVVADQFLMTRLRAMTEVAIASLITLKNAAELLQLASFYNARQLKTTCQQFICINITCLLENSALDILGEEIMDELTAYYKEMVPNIRYRRISPYEGYPPVSYLEELESQFENVELGSLISGGSYSISENQSQVLSNSAIKKSKSKKKRTRTKSTEEDGSVMTKHRDGNRKISMCSLNSESSSVDLETISEPTSPIESPRNEKGDSIGILKRIKSGGVVKSNRKIDFGDVVDIKGSGDSSKTLKLNGEKSDLLQSTSDNKGISGATVKGDSIGISDNARTVGITGIGDKGNQEEITSQKLGFRDIIAQEETQCVKAKTVLPPSGDKSQQTRPAGKKLSQKERKRLSSSQAGIAAVNIEGSQLEGLDPQDTESDSNQITPNKQAAWGKVNSSNNSWQLPHPSEKSAPNTNTVPSFLELMIHEEKQQFHKNDSSSTARPLSSKSDVNNLQKQTMLKSPSINDKNSSVLKSNPALKLKSPLGGAGGGEGGNILSWGLAASRHTPLGKGTKQSDHKTSVEGNESITSISPESPRENPWQLKQQNVQPVQKQAANVAPLSPSSGGAVAQAPPPLLHKTVSFTEILSDETKQTETRQKATKKPLQFIQMEEQAIQELLAHYGEKVKLKGAKISVERVTGLDLASPTWEAKQAHK